MSSNSQSSFRREAFAAVQPAERRALALLMAQDGSTTRLCEAVAGGPVQLQLLHQQATRQVPAAVRTQLPGEQFIERITCLTAHGEVLMDNLAYIALDGLPTDIERDLHAGAMPIGHLLARLWVRREPLPLEETLTARLWSAVGMPDASATRSYRIVTPEGPRMLITETWRRGMLMDKSP